jgi:hypothetical protein
MSKLSLKKESVTWAIKHFSIYGDTDIFPVPVEFEFFVQNIDKISTEVSEQIDLHTYKPVGIIDSLVPKSKVGFRIGHQLFPVDCLLITAATYEIGHFLEAARRPADEGVSFSYRFSPTPDGEMFASDHKFTHWLEHQWRWSLLSTEYEYVIKTDISDFFQRIYHHRIENSLLEYTGGSKIGSFVFKMIKEYTTRQSFGLPVGSDFSRIIAESTLIDIDEAMIREGIEFTRFVDDMVIFCKKGVSPYGILSFLAGHLAKCEGLSLSAQKTKIISFEDFRLTFSGSVQTGNDEDDARDMIRYEILDVYEGEEIRQEKLNELAHLDLPNLLSEELSRDIWDSNKIRILLRALKIVKSAACVDLIKENFEDLMPFIKDVVLLMEEINQENPGIFSEMSQNIFKYLAGSTCQALPVVRAWMFELLIRRIVPFVSADIKRLPWSTETLDRRQITLLYYVAEDVSYFRSKKTRLSEMNTWELTYFVYGATCLPKDEYKVWIGNIRKTFSFPLSDIFYDWCVECNKKRVFNIQRAETAMRKYTDEQFNQLTNSFEFYFGGLPSLPPPE